MKDIVLHFFAEWSNVVIALSNLVMAVSAAVAVIHFKKHWRDDEPSAVLSVDEKSFEPWRGGADCLMLEVTVFNSGKVPFHIGKLRLVDQRFAKQVVDDCILDLNVILDPGTSVTQYAGIHAKDDSVTFPKKLSLVLLNTVSQKIGELTIKPKYARTTD